MAKKKKKSNEEKLKKLKAWNMVSTPFESSVLDECVTKIAKDMRDQETRFWKNSPLKHIKNG